MTIYGSLQAEFVGTPGTMAKSIGMEKMFFFFFKPINNDNQFLWRL